MIEWTPFLTGGAAGGITGIVAGSLVGNVAQQLLQEWRDARADQREQERERRADRRALRDATKAAVIPALDVLFDAATSIIQETEMLTTVVAQEPPTNEQVFGSGAVLYSPALDKAVDDVTHAVLLVEREIEAPGVTEIARRILHAYADLDREAPVYGQTTRWVKQRQFLTGVVDEMSADAQALQQAVHAARATLDAPL